VTFSWIIKGRGGRLRCGARHVAQLGKWEAAAQPDGHFRLTVADAERDPIGWDNHDPERLIAELRLKTSDWRGRARIVSADPLVADIWRDDAGD
jgi:hypothetical protein